MSALCVQLEHAGVASPPADDRAFPGFGGDEVVDGHVVEVGDEAVGVDARHGVSALGGFAPGFEFDGDDDESPVVEQGPGGEERVDGLAWVVEAHVADEDVESFGGGGGERVESELIGRVEMGDLGPVGDGGVERAGICLLYTSPSPRDRSLSRMPSSA